MYGTYSYKNLEPISLKRRIHELKGQPAQQIET